MVDIVSLLSISLVILGDSITEEHYPNHQYQYQESRYYNNPRIPHIKVIMLDLRQI